MKAHDNFLQYTEPYQCIDFDMQFICITEGPGDIELFYVIF